MREFLSIVLLQGVVGAVVIAVGLYLLSRGKISLSNPSMSKALGLELPKVADLKEAQEAEEGSAFEFKLQELVSVKAQNPAIALLSLGVILLLVPVYIARSDVEWMEVRGKITNANPEDVTTDLVTEHWRLQRPDSTGAIRSKIVLGARDVTLHIVAAGHTPSEASVHLGEIQPVNGVYDFGIVDVTQLVGQKIVEKVAVSGPSVTPTIVPADSLPPVGVEAWYAGK